MKSAKRRVLFVIDSLACGGAEKSLVSLLPLLDYTKFDIDLMQVRSGGLFERYVPKEVRMIPLPKVSGIKCLFFRLMRLYFSLLLRICRKTHGAELCWRAMSMVYPRIKTKYDAAVAYSQGFPTYFVAEKVNALKKYAWINVDLQSAGYKEKFNREFYDKMSRIVTVSDALSEKLKRTNYLDNRRLLTVYDILNTQLIRTMAEEKGFDDLLPHGMIRIVTVARIVFLKNYSLAVKTARVLKERGMCFRWYFVGNGNERSAVEKEIERNGLTQEVVLLGEKANPYPYMRECDIYVQTSRSEGFGLTLCEARLLNKPVVSTDFTVVYDQIRDGENGLIAQMDAQSLADKIQLLAKSESLRKRLISETRKEKNDTMFTEVEKVNALLSE